MENRICQSPALFLLNLPVSTLGFYHLHYIQDDMTPLFVSSYFHYKIAMRYACASFVG